MKRWDIFGHSSRIETHTTKIVLPGPLLPLASFYNVIIATNQIFLLILTPSKRTMAAENLLELVEQHRTERIRLKEMLDVVIQLYEARLEQSEENLKEAEEDLKYVREDLEKAKEDLKKSEEDLKKAKEDLKETTEDLENTKDELEKTKEDLKKAKEDFNTKEDDLPEMGEIIGVIED